MTRFFENFPIFYLNLVHVRTALPCIVSSITRKILLRSMMLSLEDGQEINFFL